MYQDESLSERIDRLSASISTLANAGRPASKASAILAGPLDDRSAEIALDGDPDFAAALKAMVEVRTKGWNPDRGAILEPYTVKATLADTNANGGYIIPQNTVSNVVEISKGRNVFRQLMNVVPGVRSLGVNLPYELDDSSLQRAQAQGGEVLAYGSNKDTRDFTLGSATASLWPLARIIRVGNQFLNYSEGAAERLVRSKLGRAFGLAEAYYILSGTGSNNQPKGILTSLSGASSSYTTALSAETRAAALGRGIGALEARGYEATAIVIPAADYWEAATETLGTSGSGGWALSPAAGAPSTNTQQGVTLWGVPVYRDLTGYLTAGTALIADWRGMDLFFGSQFRIDVSSEEGQSFALNLTAFRAEEEMAFNADPYVLTGMVQKVTGL